MAPNVGPLVNDLSELHDPADDFWSRRDTGYASVDGSWQQALATPDDSIRSGRNAKEIRTRDEVTAAFDDRSFPRAVLGSRAKVRLSPDQVRHVTFRRGRNKSHSSKSSSSSTSPPPCAKELRSRPHWPADHPHWPADRPLSPVNQQRSSSSGGDSR